MGNTMDEGARGIGHEDRMISGDGLSVFLRSWEPEGPARAAIAIVPGFKSHSGYYVAFGARAAAEGICAYAADLRGRGRSDGASYYVDSTDEYVRDVEALVRRIRGRHPTLPIFLFGHSAGGVVACAFALRHQRELAGLICESFAYEVPAPKFVLRIIQFISRLLPRAKILRLNSKDFSRDDRAVQAMDADPKVANEAQPAATVAAMVAQNDLLERAFPEITLPVMILHGTADKVTNPSGSRFFYETVGSVDKVLKLYDGATHDLLNDIDRERVTTDIFSWIEQELSSVTTR